MSPTRIGRWCATGLVALVLGAGTAVTGSATGRPTPRRTRGRSPKH